jgi:hypothetical protein
MNHRMTYGGGGGKAPLILTPPLDRESWFYSRGRAPVVIIRGWVDTRGIETFIFLL